MVNVMVGFSFEDHVNQDFFLESPIKISNTVGSCVLDLIFYQVVIVKTRCRIDSLI